MDRLRETHGSYRVLRDLFNMDPGDYRRFLSFLKHHDCHEPFQRFRRRDVAPAARRRGGGSGI